MLACGNETWARNKASRSLSHESVASQMQRAANKSLEPTVLSIKHFAWSKMLATESRGSAYRYAAQRGYRLCLGLWSLSSLRADMRRRLW